MNEKYIIKLTKLFDDTSHLQSQTNSYAFKMKEFILAKDQSEALEVKITNVESSKAQMQDKLHVARARFDELREEVRDHGLDEETVEQALLAASA